ncbi:MAG TPA: sulfotransferase, partial [Polyangiaceae bacterium]|nr:sulfotransferase [Polyangiaceae bacterium]
MRGTGVTFGRGAQALGFGVALGGLGGAVSLARGLDRFLYPAFRGTPIPPPLFVIATPRSGTTFLHHLLALDDERFVGFKLYQTIAPALLFERAIGLVQALDGRTGGGLGRLLDAIDRRIFTAWDGIHKVGLRADEEDENLFVYSLVSPAIYLLFPAIAAHPEFVDITRLGREPIRKLARDYRETVRRLVYLTGGERAPLIKNVLLPSRLPVAEQAFPEARYVHILRDPREAIPSAVSMFYAMWQTHSPAIAEDSPETRALAGMFLEHYRLLCEEGQRQPPERWVSVRFEALVEDPVGTIEYIYARFGLTLSARFRARLEQAVSDARRFKSRGHAYDLARFGLTEDDLRQGLGEH